MKGLSDMAFTATDAMKLMWEGLGICGGRLAWCQREPLLPAVCSACSDACPIRGMLATSGNANDCEDTGPSGAQSQAQRRI